MIVWLSTIGQRLDHADNTRTMLLARYLIERGHEVTLWTSAFDHIRKQWRREMADAIDGCWTMPNGLEVRFMQGSGYKRNIGVRRLYDHLLAARDFRRQAEVLPRPDIVVASLPDHVTAAAMVAFARDHRIPSLIDVRDKWPDIFHDYAPAPIKPLVRAGLLFESRRARGAMQQATALVAMMNSMLDWGLAKAGRGRTEKDRVFYLSTMESADPVSAPLTDLGEEHREMLADSEGKAVFTFVGTYNRTQHPLLVIEAFELLSRDPGFDSRGVRLLIGGDGVNADEVDRRIAALPFARRLGWLKPPEMRAILSRSDVGLLPMNFASPAFNNKAFAYLACGIPILNGALGDLAELIAEQNVGINVPAGDTAALAASIKSLVDDPGRVAAMKARVRDLYAASFDQDQTYGDYVAHVEAIAGGWKAAQTSG
ncbi:MAG: glycosyltransferase WbuB [Sphingomonadales bacterium]|nr:MAG: glycosyltransferase WbuB [Sphingomonadales bacterium]